MAKKPQQSSTVQDALHSQGFKRVRGQMDSPGSAVGTSAGSCEERPSSVGVPGCPLLEVWEPERANVKAEDGTAMPANGESWLPLGPGVAGARGDRRAPLDCVGEVENDPNLNSWLLPAGTRELLLCREGLLEKTASGSRPPGCGCCTSGCANGSSMEKGPSDASMRWASALPVGCSRSLSQRPSSGLQSRCLP